MTTINNRTTHNLTASQLRRLFMVHSWSRD